MSKDPTFQEYLKFAAGKEGIKGVPGIPDASGDGSVMSARPNEYIMPNTTPPGIYSDARDSELEQLLDFVLGEKLAAQIRQIAANRNGRPVTVLRQTLWDAFRTGEFDVEPADVQEKRTGNDDHPNQPEFQRIQAVLAPENMAALQVWSRAVKRSTLGTLRAGLSKALGDKTT